MASSKTSQSFTTSHKHTACDEYMSLSRRGFIAASGTAAAMMATAPAWLPRVAIARNFNAAAQDVIIQIYLRGGCDGLSVVVPFNEPRYISSRPNLAMLPYDTGIDPGRAVLDLVSTSGSTNGNSNASAASITAPGGRVFFGLHPAMTALMPAWIDGKLLLVQGAGMTNASKSHFEAQRSMETARLNDPTYATGWLGRHLYSVDPMNPAALVRAIGIADGLTRVLVGAPKAVPIPDLASSTGNQPALSNFTGYGLRGPAATRPARLGVLSDLYNATFDPVRAAAISTIDTIGLLNTIGAAGYSPGNGTIYPSNAIGNSLKSAAALINAEVGVEAIAVDYSGWDTHANQGTPIATGGPGTTTGGITAGSSLFVTMQSLANAVGAFYSDIIAARGKRVTVVIMSEFGRNIGENGTVGTDHGVGNMMMVLGSAIRGGRVLTNWPGISTNPATIAHNMDLGVTIDYRDVLAEIVQQRLGNPDLASVFPGFTPTFRGVLL